MLGTSLKNTPERWESRKLHNVVNYERKKWKTLHNGVTYDRHSLGASGTINASIVPLNQAHRYEWNTNASCKINKDLLKYSLSYGTMRKKTLIIFITVDFFYHSTDLTT